MSKTNRPNPRRSTSNHSRAALSRVELAPTHAEVVRALCPFHGRNPGDPLAFGTNCNGESAACPTAYPEEL